MIQVTAFHVCTTPGPVLTGYIVFLHRRDASVNFTRPWADYEKEFGSAKSNYWMGLDRLHALTSSKRYGLRMDMTDWDGKTFWAEYGRFSVGPESGNYTLTVGDYDRTSTAYDHMPDHNGLMFSTYDRDNDKWSGGNCASLYKGGWWFNRCTYSNPTGVYLSGGGCHRTGISWSLIGRCRSYSYKIMTLTLILK